MELSKQQMLELLGGKWPNSGDSNEGWPVGFFFEEVGQWRVEDGRIVPYLGDEPLPGPDFQLVMI